MSSSKERLSDRFKRKILGRDKPNQAISNPSSSTNSGSLSLRPATPSSASRSSSPAGGNQNHPPPASEQALIHPSTGASSRSLSLRPVTPASASRSSSPAGGNNHPSPASTSLSRPANVTQQPVTSPPVPLASSSSNVPLPKVDTHTSAVPVVTIAANIASRTTVTPIGSSDQVGSVPSTVSERLWAKAYAALEQDEPDMVKSFKQDISSITNTQVSVTPSDLAKILQIKLEEHDSKQLIVTILNKRIKVREQGEKVVKFIMWSKDVIGAAAVLEPHAAIAWAGVSLLLPLVLNNSDQNHDMMAGLEQISNLILLYKARESLYLRESLSLDPTLADFERCVIDLYAKILEYQIRMYLHLGRRGFQRGARNLIKMDDWSGWSTEILALDALCLKFTDLIDVEKEQAYMSRQSDYSRKQIDLEKSILDVMEAMLRSQREKSNNKCLQALSSDYKGQKNLVPARVPKTCEWFLNDKRFLDWRDKQSSALLWVSADPGCGKSVLARCLVDEHFLSKTTTTSTICYFFFKDGQDGRNESHHAIAALLHCLFSSNLAEDLIKYAELSYSNHGNKLSSMFTELWSILMKVVADPDAGEIVCLIDALDECRVDSRNVFLRTLIDFYEYERIASTKTTRLKFIITSRPYSDIYDEFSQLAQTSTYIHCSGEDESEKISQEIDLVIAVRVPKQLSRLKAEAQQQIIEHLREIKGRTYLWLYLTLDLLQKTISTNNTVERIRKVMASLPKQIYDTYSALLDKSSNPEQARILLQIITVARRPLTLHELRVAWEIARDADGSFTKYEDLADFLTEDPNFPTDLRNLCGLLISIYDGQVYLLHQTVREWAIATLNEARFDISEAEQLMTKICTKYLALDDFGQLELPDPGLYSRNYGDKVVSLHASYTFLQYATAHWVVHFQSSQSPTEAVHTETCLQLFRAGSDRCKLWLSEWCQLQRVQLQSWCSWTDLTIAAAIGAVTFVPALLQSGVNVNDHGWIDRSVWAAARWGHVEMVELLLAEGLDINSGDTDGSSALIAAAYHGHQSVVELLLEHGTEHRLEELNSSGEAPVILLGASNSKRLTTVLDMNALNGNGDTALHLALVNPTRNKSKMIARLLIENGADCEVQNQAGYTPLLYAVANGNEEVTELLLEKRVNINIKSHLGSYAVQYAVRYGHERVLKLLLGRGADLHTHNDNGEGLVALAAKSGRENILKLLLDHGADINARDTKYNNYSALDQAVWKGEQDIVRILLERGADHGCALHNAAANDQLGMVELLLAEGVDIDTRDEDGYTALTDAAMEGQQKIVIFLLERGADINARNNAGDSALDRAIQCGQEEIARILVDHGADFNTQSLDGYNALDLVTLRGQETIAQMLIDHGAENSAELEDWPSKQLQSMFGE